MKKRNYKRYPNPYLKIGTKVISRYAASWTGIVEVICQVEPGHNVVRCRITHDRNGNPMRKTFLSQSLDTYWLRVIDDTKTTKHSS